MRYKMRMPIGDWSDDGHGKCEYYVVNSALPVADVREAHFSIKDVTGVDIEKLCSEYEDSTVSMTDLCTLKSLGVIFSEESVEYEHNGEEFISVCSEDMAHIWLTLLNHVNPELDLIKEEKIPMIPFYGRDKKGRHISSIGYGTLY